MEGETLDHVALWVGDRERIADFATSALGMHVVERTATFTLVGSDARRGKLTLFAAEPPRERGALKHVALRVTNLERACSLLPPDLPLERSSGGEVVFEVGEGLRLGLVEAQTPVEYDLDHVALFSERPDETAAQYASLGFAAAPAGVAGVPRVEVGGAFVEFHSGGGPEPGGPLLNHLAVRVRSAERSIAEAEERGLEIANVVDAPNTSALFIWGPERVKLEYVEHKASFSLK